MSREHASLQTLSIIALIATITTLTQRSGLRLIGTNHFPRAKATQCVVRKLLGHMVMTSTITMPDASSYFAHVALFPVASGAYRDAISTRHHNRSMRWRAEKCKNSNRRRYPLPTSAMRSVHAGGCDLTIIPEPIDLVL